MSLVANEKWEQAAQLASSNLAEHFQPYNLLLSDPDPANSAFIDV